MLKKVKMKKGKGDTCRNVVEEERYAFCSSAAEIQIRNKSTLVLGTHVLDMFQSTHVLGSVFCLSIFKVLHTYIGK